MKRLSRIISILLILSMFSTCVYADNNTNVSRTNDVTTEENIDGTQGETQETITLAIPTISSIVVSGTAVTVKFNHVENATEYVVKYRNGSNIVEKAVEKSPYSILELKQNREYAFWVKAIHKDENGNVIESDYSRGQTIRTEKITLSKPTLKLAAYNKGAILTWSKVKNATGYEVYRYYNGKWTKIKTTGEKTLTYKNTGLKVGKTYKYRVRAIRKTSVNSATGAFSSTKSIKVKTYLTSSTIKVGYSTGRLWVASKKYAEGSNKNVISKVKIKAGTKVTIVERKQVKGSSMAKVKLSNGKTYWIKAFNIIFNSPYTTKDYTTEVKENFVNKKGYSSKTKYLIFICHYTQRIYLFKGSKGKWDLQKTYRCASGKASTRTPLGVYRITKKGKRTALGSKYVTYFKGANAFHARPYGSKTMGKPASNGCVRMYEKDAIYFYKSMPKKTTVVSY